MEQQSKVVITTSNQIQDLSTKVDKINSHLDDLKKNFKPSEPTELLTRNEVAELFKIDLSSVHNWTKRGKLKSYGISGSARVYYKRSEINQLLIQINKG
jgi:hypothetical protein